MARAGSIPLTAAFFLLGICSSGLAQSATPEAHPNLQLILPKILISGQSYAGKFHITTGEKKAFKVYLNCRSGAIQLPPFVNYDPNSPWTPFRFKVRTVQQRVQEVMQIGWKKIVQKWWLDLYPEQPVLLTTEPHWMPGGQTATGTVTLKQRAGIGGEVISLFSKSVMVQLPLSVTVPQGETTATFPITTSSVSAPDYYEIRAESPGGFKCGMEIGLVPPIVKSLVLSPSTTTGGNVVTATVTISDPAPDGGSYYRVNQASVAVVIGGSALVYGHPTPVPPRLRRGLGAVGAPKTFIAGQAIYLFVPAGQTTQTFTVTALQVPTTVKAPILVSNVSATLTIAPTVSVPKPPLN